MKTQVMFYSICSYRAQYLWLGKQQSSPQGI